LGFLALGLLGGLYLRIKKQNKTKKNGGALFRKVDDPVGSDRWMMAFFLSYLEYEIKKRETRHEAGKSGLPPPVIKKSKKKVKKGPV
jgi:hypothetical protein